MAASLLLSLAQIRVLIHERNAPRISGEGKIDSRIILHYCELGNSPQLPPSVTERMLKRKRATKLVVRKLTDAGDTASKN